MSVLGRKLRREMLSSKGLLLAIVSIITVGVMCFIYIRSAYYNLSYAQEDYYAQCRMADFWLRVKKAPVAELQQVAELPGVADVDKRIANYATVDLEDVVKPLSGLVVSLPDERRPVINDIVLRRGGYFTDRRDEEVIVNDAFARVHELRPGQTIHLLLNNRRQGLVIVGTAISSEFTYLVSPGSIAPDPEHFGVFYLKRSYAEDVFDMQGAANELVGRMHRGAEYRTEEILDQAELALDDYGVLSTTPREDQPSHLMLSSEIEGLGTFASILPGIFLTVAALVLGVLLTRLAEQQRTVIGTLKALGYSDRRVSLHFLTYGLIVGVIGGLLGCLAGYGMSNLVMRIYLDFFEFPELRNHVYPGTYALGITISVVCALLGSLRGARTALRLRPAEAMRPKPPAIGGRVFLEHVGWFWNRLSFSWRMALRNIVRHRLRTAVGLFAAAMGAALLVMGLMGLQAMEFMVDFQFNKISRSDLDLVLESPRGIEALYDARRLPGVDYAEPVLNVACTFRNGNHEHLGSITGLISDARLTIPRDGDGEVLAIPEAGLLMTLKTAQLLDVDIGETVRVEFREGLQRKVDVPVVRISQSYLGTAVYADLEYLSKLVGEGFALTSVQLELEDDPQIETALYQELKQLPALETASSRKDMIRNLTEKILEVQRTFIGLLALFAGVIFFGSVLNASLVSLAERLREVATLRVLGYGPWRIGGLIFRESMLVNSIGTLLGLPLGYGLFLLLSASYDMQYMRMPVVPAAWIWITVIALSIVFLIAAHLVVQARIHRLHWLDALNVRE